MSIPTSAMLLAAGLGTRMRPLTDTIPKPLVPVAGRALIDRALDRLQEAGVTQAVVNVSYKATLIEAHLAQRAHPHIIFSHEDTPLETGGGIARALSQLGSGPFFSMNADVIVRSGAEHFLKRLWQRWDDSAMDALLLLHPVEQAVGYDGSGDFNLRPDGTLLRERDQTSAPYVFTGVQVLHPRLFAGVQQQVFSMNVLYEKLIGEGRLYGIVHDGQWLHVGDIKGIAAAEAALAAA